MSNWAGNYQYKAAHIHHPETVEQVQEIVSQAKRVKVVGSRHSFNNIADCTEDLISLDDFTPLIELDREQKQVTINANLRYGQLGQYLYRHGYALHNLASLPHISVAGACATATH
ncbi:MAG: FAD-binding protein, partial [Chloroflexota bacterium]